jgi:2-methylcitrate dehydratase PrpD
LNGRDAEGMTDETLTEGLVALIRARPVEDDDLEIAALLVLDAVANALAGRNTGPGRILRGWGRVGDAGRRAFLMGGLTHILEIDDLHRTSVTHPGCTVTPAAFALGLDHGCDGAAVLRAVLHGYEAIARVGMAVGPAHYRIWHNTATCGPYGSAMAAAAILDLDDAAAVHALGNAGTQSAGLWQFLATGAMSKHLHAGRAAEAGVVAAELAGLGFTGPPMILEGAQGFFAAACPDADPAAVLRDAQAPWQVHATSIKPWPSCRHTHPAIDAAIELSGRLDPAAIAEIEIATYGAALDVCDRAAPSGAYEAKFSLQHCVARALMRGAVWFDDFDAPARSETAALCARTTVQTAEIYSEAYPDSWGGEVAVTLADGTRLSARRRHCKGDPEAALDAEEMVSKARALLRLGGVDDAETLISGILDMAAGGPLVDPGLWRKAVGQGARIVDI